MTISVVFALAALIVVLGGAVELLRVLRTAPVPGDNVPRETGSLSNVLVWMGMTATTLLTIAMLRDVTLQAREITPILLCLGLAGERAGYLVKTWHSRSSDARNSTPYLAATAVTLLGSVIVGLNL